MSEILILHSWLISHVTFIGRIALLDKHGTLTVWVSDSRNWFARKVIGRTLLPTWNTFVENLTLLLISLHELLALLIYLFDAAVHITAQRLRLLIILVDKAAHVRLLLALVIGVSYDFNPLTAVLLSTLILLRCFCVTSHKLIVK